MRLLRKIWDALLEYADILLSLVAIIIVVILGFFIRQASLQQVLTGVLFIVTLTALGLLRNRRDNRAIKTALAYLTQTAHPPQNGIYPRQEDAYTFLEDYIIHHPVKEAILIQYSGTSSLKVLQWLVRKDAHVTIYVQHEDSAMKIGSELQYERIRTNCKHLRGVLHDLSRFKMYKYIVPGSVSAIRIDDQLLCMGWYTYEHVVASNRNPNFQKDTIEISGHDRAALVVWQGSEEFNALNQTFDELIKNYQASGLVEVAL